MTNDRDALTQAWLRAEREAVAAESELAGHGQVQATPEYRDKAVGAADLRRQADELFARLHALLRERGDPEP